MASKREDLIAAILAALAAAVPLAEVARDKDVPGDVTEAGMVVLRSTEPPEPDPMLGSVGPWYVTETFSIDVYAAADDGGGGRFSIVDGLEQSIAARVAADRTFGGFARGCALARGGDDEDSGDGVQTVRASRLLLTVDYVSLTEI